MLQSFNNQSFNVIGYPYSSHSVIYDYAGRELNYFSAWFLMYELTDRENVALV